MLNQWVTGGEVPLEDLMNPYEMANNKQSQHDNPVGSLETSFLKKSETFQSMI